MSATLFTEYEVCEFLVLCNLVQTCYFLVLRAGAFSIWTCDFCRSAICSAVVLVTDVWLMLTQSQALH